MAVILADRVLVEQSPPCYEGLLWDFAPHQSLVRHEICSKFAPVSWEYEELDGRHSND
jgi:hypothetical protein